MVHLWSSFHIVRKVYAWILNNGIMVKLSPVAKHLTTKCQYPLLFLISRGAYR